MQTPYQGGANYYGYGATSDEEVATCIRKSLLEYQQPLVHYDGDIAAEQYLTQFKKIIREPDAKDALRPVIIHAQLVQKEQLERMKPLQMIPSFFTVHVWHWGDVHIENFKAQRASLISPLQDALQLELTFTLHTDTPIIVPNLIESVWCAAARRVKNGVLLEEKECIDVYETPHTITQYAVWQYHEKGQKGTLEAGRPADFAVLDQNPLGILMGEIRNTQVLEAWKKGTYMYKRQA